MKRQREDISKNTKYILVCIAIVISEIGGIIAKSASVFEVVGLDMVVLVPIIVKRFKYDTDFGKMLIEGLIRGVIWAAVWIGVAFLAKSNPLIMRIATWPITPV